MRKLVRKLVLLHKFGRGVLTVEEYEEATRCICRKDELGLAEHRQGCGARPRQPRARQ